MFRVPSPQILSLLALCGSIALGTPGAFANGRFPRAQHLVVQPGERADSYVLRTTFGILGSDDGAATFRFYCEEAFQYLDGYDPTTLLAPGGGLIVGIQDGAMLLPPDRCSPVRLPDLEGQTVVDLANDPSGVTIFAALASSDPVTVARVARSDDGGRTFQLPLLGMSGVRLETVEVAPSNTMRVYASGYALTDGRDVFLRSDDGGNTFAPTSATVAGTAGWFISGVDPRDGDVIYLRASLSARGPSDAGAIDAGNAGGTVLLKSVDGGDHFAEITRTPDPMQGFAISGDGHNVFVGSPMTGLSRSDDGAPFATISHVPVECLRWDRGSLFVCESFVQHGVLLGRSRDLGATIEPVLRADDIQGPPTCPAGTILHDICPARWSTLRQTIAPVSPMDASVADAPPAMTPSCGCRSAPSPSSREGRGLLAAAAIAMCAALERRRTSRSSY